MYATETIAAMETRIYAYLVQCPHDVPIWPIARDCNVPAHVAQEIINRMVDAGRVYNYFNGSHMYRANRGI